MSRKVRILEVAADEAAAAATWYEMQSPGLGMEFDRAVDAALDLIQEDIVPLSPVPGAPGERGAKRLILKRFPYDVVVRETDAAIVVIAFAHHSRRPGYWRKRSST
jgi:hypothetical protein